MTSWLDKPLRVSINPRLINKNDRNDIPAYRDGWVNCQLTAIELRDSISQGYAYCAQLSGGRSTANFAGTDIVSVDVDGTRSLADVRLEPLVEKYATLIYTTVRHTEDENRFRIIFALPETVLDAAKLKAIAASLALRLGADPAVVDASHAFYGSKGCKHWLFDRGLTSQMVEELAVHGIQGESNASGPASVRSRVCLATDEVITCEDGKTGTIADFPLRTRIHCPRHTDRHASAFILANKRGERGIHCSACRQTYWPERIEAASYSFDSFDAVVKERGNGQEIAAIGKPVGCEDPAALASLERTTVRLLHSQYLPNDLKIGPGVTLIKSAKGTGKTEFLRSFLRKAPGRVLLIGHRRVLIDDLCHRLSLTSYRNKDVDGISPNWDRQERYGVSLDSLASIRTSRPYDYVIFDECEQVLAHFLSATMKEKRLTVLKHLSHIVSKAGKVVGLDADIGWTTFATLMKWRERVKPDETATIHLNEWKKSRGPLEVYQSRKHILADLQTTVSEGHRCYVTSDEKKLIDQIENDLISGICAPSDILKITSDSTDTPEVKRFLSDPAKEALRYRAILTSPAVPSGVDIAFPSECSEISHVYGMFEGILNHFECDQQLSRVRHPEVTRVWISPRKRGLETASEVVKSDLRRSYMFGHLLRAFDEDGRPIYEADDALLDLATYVNTIDRASKNNLRANFSLYKASQGWTVTTIIDPKIEDASTDDVQSLSGTRMVNDEDVVLAKSLTSEEFYELLSMVDDGIDLSWEQLAAVKRKQIETFYRTEVSFDLLAELATAPSRTAIRRFEALIQKDRLGQEGSPANTSRIRSINQQVELVKAALAAAKLFDCGRIVTGVQVSKGSLKEFSTLVEKRKTEYEVQFGITVRNDLQANPIQTLNEILAFVELKLERGPKKKHRGATTYPYYVSPEQVSQLEKWVIRRNPTYRIAA